MYESGAVECCLGKLGESGRRADIPGVFSDWIEVTFCRVICRHDYHYCSRLALNNRLMALFDIFLRFLSR